MDRRVLLELHRALVEAVPRAYAAARLIPHVVIPQIYLMMATSPLLDHRIALM